jgi:hypothetical protein
MERSPKRPHTAKKPAAPAADPVTPTTPEKEKPQEEVPVAPPRPAPEPGPCGSRTGKSSRCDAPTWSRENPSASPARAG